MEKQPKLTLIGLIVVILVTSFVFLVLIPVRDKISRIANKIVCGTNLKGIGTSIIVYSNDYDDNYPQLPGQGAWAKKLGFSYDLEKPNFEIDQSQTDRTISASLYLLVKEVDVHPKSFVCPYADQIEFDGSNPKNLGFVDFWDFGPDPYKHVSYAYHNPYGKYPPNGWRSAAFAIAADMNPWFKNGDIVPPGQNNDTPQIINIPPDLLDAATYDHPLNRKWRELWKPSNSLNELPYTHPLKKKAKHSEGQNVLWADGHFSFERTPNTGIKRDNIYTFWSTDENLSEQDIQGGTAPTSRSEENDAQSETDSFLAI